MIVVADSSPLIGLAKARHLNLLSRLYGEPVLIPPRVFVDVVIDGKGRAGARSVKNAIDRGWLRVLPVTDYSLIPYRFAGLGEGEAIALALQTGADILLMDDRAARNEAGRLGVSCLSTGGVLLDARQSGMLRTIKPVLDRMQAKGFGVRNYEDLLRLAGEDF